MHLEAKPGVRGVGDEGSDGIGIAENPRPGTVPLRAWNMRISGRADVADSRDGGIRRGVTIIGGLHPAAAFDEAEHDLWDLSMKWAASFPQRSANAVIGVAAEPIALP